MTIDLPWKGRDVPCAILDILRGCNARCAFCYNQDTPHCKGIDNIRAELDELCRLRNLQAVMISGGEPMIHPNLLDVVRMVKAKGLVAILLTNGILLEPGTASELRRAGCDLCYLHIQSGQIREDMTEGNGRDEAQALMRKKSEILVAAGIRVGCCITLQADDKDGIARECDAFFANRNLSNMLITTARSAGDFDLPSCPDLPIDELLARFKSIGLVPFASLSGKIDKRTRRWFSFQVVEAHSPDGTMRRRICLRASYGELIAMKLQHLVRGRYDFTLPPMSSAFLRARLLLNAITGGAFARSLALALRPGWKLSFRNVALDVPPYRRADGRIEFCEDCPGAILKNGKLRPLCLSDITLPESFSL